MSFRPLPCGTVISRTEEEDMPERRGSSICAGLWGRLSLAALAVVAALAVTACGSASSSNSGSASATSSSGGGSATSAGGATSSSASSGDAYMARVKAVVKGGESDFLYDPKPDLAGTLNPNNMEILTPGQWRGPTSSPKAPKNQSVEVISCAGRQRLRRRRRWRHRRRQGPGLEDALQRVGFHARRGCPRI